MNSKLYRTSKIGECLRESLFELIEAGKIAEDVAEKVLSQFDKSTYTALDTHVHSKAILKGDLKTYRYLDNVWQFVLEAVTLKLQPSRPGCGGDVTMQSAKLVCVDSKLIQKEKEEREEHERAVEQRQAAMVDTVAIKTELGLPLKKEEEPLKKEEDL